MGRGFANTGEVSTEMAYSKSMVTVAKREQNGDTVTIFREVSSEVKMDLAHGERKGNFFKMT